MELLIFKLLVFYYFQFFGFKIFFIVNGEVISYLFKSQETSKIY